MGKVNLDRVESMMNGVKKLFQEPTNEKIPKVIMPGTARGIMIV